MENGFGKKTFASIVINRRRLEPLNKIWRLRNQTTVINLTPIISFRDALRIVLCIFWVGNIDSANSETLRVVFRCLHFNGHDVFRSRDSFNSIRNEY